MHFFKINFVLSCPDASIVVAVFFAVSRISVLRQSVLFERTYGYMLVPLETSLVPGGKSDNRWSCQSVQAGSSSGLHICGVHCPAGAGCPMQPGTSGLSGNEGSWWYGRTVRLMMLKVGHCEELVAAKWWHSSLWTHWLLKHVQSHKAQTGSRIYFPYVVCLSG